MGPFGLLGTGLAAVGAAGSRLAVRILAASGRNRPWPGLAGGA